MTLTLTLTQQELDVYVRARHKCCFPHMAVQHGVVVAWVHPEMSPCIFIRLVPGHVHMAPLVALAVGLALVAVVVIIARAINQNLHPLAPFTACLGASCIYSALASCLPSAQDT